MAAQGRTVYIAGAGIAGLTLALALAKFGTTVVVLEKADALPEHGVGLQVSPNARRVLDRLGLSRAVAAASLEPHGIDVYPFRHDRPVVTLTLGAAAARRYGCPYAVMHRADLAQVLFRACRRFANIDIVFGVKSFDIVTHARGITVATEEKGGRSRTARPFTFIGADGVHSRTRSVVLAGPEARYSGYIAWRALVGLDAIDGILRPGRTSLLWGPGYHAVAYPLPHRAEANIALFTKVPARLALGEAPPAAPRLGKRVLPSARFNALMAAVGEDGWSAWPVHTVSTKEWHDGAIGLIGDAAHAMMPFQAQGAAMAIEDAGVLAPLLVTEPSAEAALSRFAAFRRARVERVARISAGNGRIFHLDWPLTVPRNLVVRLQGPEGHFRRLDWLHGWDASPEIEAGARKPA